MVGNVKCVKGFMGFFKKQSSEQIQMSCLAQWFYLLTKEMFAGKNAPEGVMVLPLDVTSEVSILKEAVVKVESAFMGAGIDIMVHNAAYSRPKHAAVEIPEEELKVSSPFPCSV
jgi:NAD(P)-dependent dehydrogenase (short-subunit alcohol dehydrogenase family)